MSNDIIASSILASSVARVRGFLGPQPSVASVDMTHVGVTEPHTFFVDPSSTGPGSDSNSGLDPLNPLLTLQAAIDLCVGGRGDVVICERGGQTVTETVNFNKSGITVIGRQQGMNPFAQGEFFTLLADAAFVDGPVATITAPCHIEGLGFASRDTGATFFSGAAMLIGGAATADPFGVVVRKCRFPKWGLDNRIGIAVEGSSNCLIEECDFEGVGADFEAGIYVQGATQNLVIRNNHFRQCTAAVQFGAFAGGGPHIIMERNIVEDGLVLDSQANTATGVLVDNFSELAAVSSYDASVATLQAQGIQFSGNHYSE